MTTSEALTVLEECAWLKVTANHVSATKYRSRVELAMLSRADLSHPYSMYKAHVQTRRAKGETFEGLLVRAATLIASGHLPKVRVPPQRAAERCMCGSDSRDLTWNQQLKQRVCPRCERAWRTAANNNDIRATNGEVQ